MVVLKGSLSDFENKYGNSSNALIQKMLASARAKYGVDEASNFGQFSDLEKRLRDAGYGDLVDSARSQWTSVFSNYHEGVLDRLASGFGARSGFDINREYALAQYAEALNGIAQQGQQNEFNAPIAQAARMRQAGQNPDLLGTGDVAGAASPAEDTNNILPATASLSLDHLSQFGSTMFNCFQGALGLAQSFASLKSIRLDNDGKEISNRDNMIGLAKSIVLAFNPTISSFDADDPDSMDTDNSMALDPDFRRKTVLDKLAFLDPSKHKSGLSKRNYRALKDAVVSVLDSSETNSDVLSSLSNEMTSQQEVVGKHDSRYYSPDFHKLRVAFQPLIQARDEITQLVLDYEKNKAEYDSEYYQQMNDLEGGSVMAQSDLTVSQSNAETSIATSESAKLKALSDKIAYIEQAAKSKVIQELTKMADDGDVGAEVMIWLYSFGDMINLSGTVGNLTQIGAML